jgi:hypothetical protein
MDAGSLAEPSVCKVRGSLGVSHRRMHHVVFLDHRMLPAAGREYVIEQVVARRAMARGI